MKGTDARVNHGYSHDNVNLIGSSKNSARAEAVQAEVVVAEERARKNTDK